MVYAMTGTRMIRTELGRTDIVRKLIGSAVQPLYYKPCADCNKQLGPWHKEAHARKAADKCRTCGLQDLPDYIEPVRKKPWE